VVVTDYLLYLYAESPVHTGAAGSQDVLDLPVQREASTRYPVIWGQSLKGALRQAAGDATWVTGVFGSAPGDSDGDGGGTTAGTLAVGDAQLVAMPVPALRHTFAWVTSELALSRLARKYKVLKPDTPVPGLPRVNPEDGLASSTAWGTGTDEVLGPCLVRLTVDAQLTGWAERIAADVLDWDPVFSPFAVKLRQDLVLVGSDLIVEVLAESTEQAVRVQLGDNKTVKNGGPFYSEYLPAETIMGASLTLRGSGDTEDKRAAIEALLDRRLLQIGGDETLGKGLMWGRLVKAPS
jgi:CRISPR-associated protein Cmr4